MSKKKPKFQVQCKNCGKIEEVLEHRSRNYVCCSYKCSSEFRRDRTIKICEGCGREFEVVNYGSDRRKNCSKECLGVSHSRNYVGEGNPNCQYPKLKFDFLEVIDTEEKAYFLGWVASDGTIPKSGISIALHEKDESILHWFSYVMSEGTIPIKIKGDNQRSVTFSSMKLAQDAAKHLKVEVSNPKSSIVQFPELDRDELKWDFLRGYFDGDGSICSINNKHNYPTCHINSNSVDMIKSIKEFTNNHGISEYDVRWSGANCIDFLGKLYEGASCFLPRKRDLYQDWSEWIPSIIKKSSQRDYFESFSWAKCHVDALPPFKDRVSDSGFDLTAIRLVSKKGMIEVFGTGIKINPAHGYYFDMVARSSLHKYGYVLANSIGIIDRSYKGEILIPLLKFDKDKPDLELPIRCVQIIPRTIIHVQWQRVDEFPEDSLRADGGFGSTGK